MTAHDTEDLEVQAQRILGARRQPSEVSDLLQNWPVSNLQALKQTIDYIDATNRGAQLDVALRFYPGSTRLRTPVSAAILVPRMDIADVADHLQKFANSADARMKLILRYGLPNLFTWCVDLDRRDRSRTLLQALKPSERADCIHTALLSRPRAEDLQERLIDHMVSAGMPGEELVTALTVSIGQEFEVTANLQRIAVYREGMLAPVVEKVIRALQHVHASWSAELDPELLLLADQIQHRTRLKNQAPMPTMLAP